MSKKLTEERLREIAKDGEAAWLGESQTAAEWESMARELLSLRALFCSSCEQVKPLSDVWFATSPDDPTPKLWRWCGECTKAHTVGLEGGHECQKGQARKAKTMSKEPPCLKVCCDRNGTGLKLIEIARAIEKRMEVPTKAIREDHPTAQAANAELFAYWWVLFAMERISGIPVRTTPTTDPEQSGPLNVSGPVAWREPR
jgi:hypothetical protein